MTMLVIDTATRFCQVGLYDAATDCMLAARSDDIGRGHAERLMGMVAELMDAHAQSFEALAGVAVTVGPGSFTGIRVGVAAARGFALPCHFSAIGVTTLQSLADQASVEMLPHGPSAVVVEGGRDQIFLQHFDRRGTPIDQPRAVASDRAHTMIAVDANALVGDAALSIAGRMDRPVTAHIDRPVGTIDAVARSAQKHPVLARPLYLRGADAKPQTGFALPHADRTVSAP